MSEVMNRVYSPAELGVTVLATQVGDALQEFRGRGPAKGGRLADDVGEVGGSLIVSTCQQTHYNGEWCGEEGQTGSLRATST